MAPRCDVIWSLDHWCSTELWQNKLSFDRLAIPPCHGRQLHWTGQGNISDAEVRSKPLDPFDSSSTARARNGGTAREAVSNMKKSPKRILRGRRKSHHVGMLDGHVPRTCLKERALPIRLRQTAKGDGEREVKGSRFVAPRTLQVVFQAVQFPSTQSSSCLQRHPITVIDGPPDMVTSLLHFPSMVSILPPCELNLSHP